MSKYKLVLFYFPSCPFCQMVTDLINRNNISVELTNVLEDGQALKKLVKDTGRRTVPVLYINDRPMAESRDIMTWLESNLEKLEQITN